MFDCLYEGVGKATSVRARGYNPEGVDFFVLFVCFVVVVVIFVFFISFVFLGFMQPALMILLGYFSGKTPQMQARLLSLSIYRPACITASPNRQCQT